jgi:hypothetical protein
VGPRERNLVPMGALRQRRGGELRPSRCMSSLVVPCLVSAML